jgi:hypothetical protein
MIAFLYGMNRLNAKISMHLQRRQPARQEETSQDFPSTKQR